MNTSNLDLDMDEEVEEGGFLKKNWLALAVMTLVLAGGTSAAIALSSKGGAGTRKAQDVMLVQIPPPPPVVLPPPPPPPPVEEEMIENKDETPKEEAPADTAPSTGVVSNGPADAYGLRAKGGNGRRNIAPVSPMSLWAPYASQAASRIADAMRHHATLKKASIDGIRVRIWIDSTGRITRAVVPPTGNSAVDAALQGEVLTGMQLAAPPPQGMRMPVNLKVTARR
ncbi:MAG TPA: energy transducer TonB [Verrucomicrobiales bacterium]|jgi:hypothetical protein|nr:energy transducer TonB [Verrucomicrobiales bacterium]